jgi:hypothetical protein
MLILLLVPAFEISAHKKTNGHNNYRGYDYYENMLCGHFLSRRLKRTFYYVHLVSISSL